MNTPAVILPKPVHKHILVKNPITLKDIEGEFDLSPAEKEDKLRARFKELFPDGTTKYMIAAVAEDCDPIFKVGLEVSMTYGGATRPHQPIMNGEYTLISQGDIGLIW